MKKRSQMVTKGFMDLLVILAVATLSGCASYRTNSDLSFSQTERAPSTQGVLIAIDSLPGRQYTVCGSVEATVKKLTIFHPNPTKKQANAVLAKKARRLGANAVIKVKYESGVSADSWGYLTARGTAVKLTSK